MNPYFLYPALINCRKFFLKAYKAYINIGVHECEKKNKQLVLINVDVFVDLAKSTPKSDCFNEVIDYNFIRNGIIQCVNQGHINLQETLCDDIVKTMFFHSQVKAVRVSTEKSKIYPGCRGIGVEVFRIK